MEYENFTENMVDGDDLSRARYVDAAYRNEGSGELGIPSPFFGTQNTTTNEAADGLIDATSSSRVTPVTMPISKFECVRDTVRSLLVGRAVDNQLGPLFLSTPNLHFIFYEYIRRYENETGWIIDPQTHRLDSFSSLIYDAYLMGMCKYQPFLGATRAEKAELVNRWNEDTIGCIVFEALKESRKKVNWLRRARDPLYGRRSFNPIQLTKPSVEKIEDSWRYAYRNISKRTVPLTYAFAVPDD